VNDEAALVEAQLVDEARRGSTRAFSRLVIDNQVAVRGFLSRMGSDPGEVDDIAQDAFVTAWSRLRSFRGEGATFRSWVCRIAYRRLIDSVRSGRRRRRREFLAAELEALERPASDAPHARLDLVQALQSLPPAQRASVALCLGEDFSHGEAAGALSLPIGTVKSHILRARAKLLSLLGEDYRHD
jgi:RNA polymerase sigma factor (sigma-70 family)